MNWRFLFTPFICLVPSIVPAQTPNTFVPTGSMGEVRFEHTATLLANGKVLILGGSGTAWLQSTEVYDPVLTSFAPGPSMTTPRGRHTATLLTNGRILVAGGVNSTGNLMSAELFDPGSGNFALTTNMVTDRSGHTATLLQNGKVLLVGGFGGISGVTQSAEIYDPATGTFSATGSMAISRAWHTATLLQNGKVLVAGGFTLLGCCSAGTADSAEIYDPSSGNFTAAAGSMTTPRELHTATILPDGRVIMAGGLELQGGYAVYKLTAEIYDPTTGTFAATGSMTITRALHTATLLLNGQVLVAGGFAGSTSPTAELYDLTAGTFTATGSMATPREEHTATLLPNGSVLISGGANNTSGVLASAEIYNGPATIPAWQNVSGPWNSECGKSFGAIAIHPKKPDVVYIGSSDITNGCGFYKSTDGGHAWTAIDVGFPKVGVLSDHFPAITKIAIAPSDPHILYAGTFVDAGFGIFFGEVYQSVNGGNKWVNVSGKISIFGQRQIQKPVLDISIDPNNPGVVFIGLMEDGIFRTANGGHSWTETRAGSVAIGATDYFTVVRTAPSNGSTIYGAGFTNFSGPSIFCAFIADPFAGAGGGNDGCIELEGVLPLIPIATSDVGRRWIEIYPPTTGALISDLAVDSANKNFVYAATVGYLPPLLLPQGNKGVFKSTNGGASWLPINNLAGGDMSQFPILKLALDPKANNSLYAVAGLSGIFNSSNGGDTWERLTTIGFPYPTAVENIAFGNRKLYALTSNGIYVKTQ